jgi:hypothetical protein
MLVYFNAFAFVFHHLEGDEVEVRVEKLSVVAFVSIDWYGVASVYSGHLYDVSWSHAVDVGVVGDDGN